MAPSAAWHVEDLTLSNFRCFSHVEMSFDPQLTIIVGTNGSGKSTILDGLIVMLGPIVRELGDDSNYSFAESDVRSEPRNLDSVGGVAEMVLRYPVEGEMQATVAGHSLAWSRRKSSPGRYTSRISGDLKARMTDVVAEAKDAVGPEPVLPVIAAYGVERLLGVRRASGAIGKTRFGAYAAALDRQSDLSRLSGFLADLATSISNAHAFGDEPPLAARAQFDAIERACGIVLAETGWARPRWNPLVDAITLTHPRYGTLPLAYLSTGIKITAGLVIDLASRMARANPSLGSADLLDTVSGVVMIDEIDLHLHTTWQQSIVAALQRAFPRVQFIVTTHSPQVLSTVGAEHVRVLDGETVRRVEHAEGLRSDVVMREILGTDPEPDVPPRRSLHEYMAMVRQGLGTTNEAKQLRARLEHELGGIDNIPEFADADAAIAFDEILGE